MGLFGYGKGDYKKNSALIEERIEALLRFAPREEFALVPGANALRESVKHEYPVGADGKQLKLIDERVTALFDSLEDYAKKGLSFGCRARTAALYSLIKERRDTGKPYPEDYAISYEDRFAECGSKIEKLIAEREARVTKLRQAKEQSERAPDDSLAKAKLINATDALCLVISELAPYIGQLNRFVEQLALCGHTFAKLSATAEKITREDLHAVIELEIERIKNVKLN